MTSRNWKKKFWQIEKVSVMDTFFRQDRGSNVACKNKVCEKGKNVRDCICRCCSQHEIFIKKGCKASCHLIFVQLFDSYAVNWLRNPFDCKPVGEPRSVWNWQCHCRLVPTRSYYFTFSIFPGTDGGGQAALPFYDRL